MVVGAGMPKNIVICCDGTGNEVEQNLSNVLKLYRVVTRSAQQVVYYDPGVGTLGRTSAWNRLRQNAMGVFGLATGYGLDDNVTNAYRFLCRHYEEGDAVFLFGFSRGAYTVRVLAGFLRLVGLLRPEQINLADHAFTAFKQAATSSSFEVAWRFRRVIGARDIPIRFLGIWDTVSSVIVPRADRLYVPSLQTLPYTATNDAVEAVRHAAAIDERRRMFRLNRWTEPQTFQPNRFASASARPQDIKQVWFAGVHADIGGGYPEEESAIAKYPLGWMIREARAHGLKINTAMKNHLVLGRPRKGASRTYSAPAADGPLHKSLTWGWRAIEWIPKRVKWRTWKKRPALAGWYVPWGEPRAIPEGARIHSSVVERMKTVPGYRPPNLPKAFVIER
jgi:uncharacterized protein (DUF2235 family)